MGQDDVGDKRADFADSAGGVNDGRGRGGAPDTACDTE